MMDISSKTSIVTGAASGIGLGIATTLAEASISGGKDRSGGAAHCASWAMQP
jgi:NAD(P)-dependent dehydrogenase (short-subunit alcohol dehydrogenase family)